MKKIHSLFLASLAFILAFSCASIPPAIAAVANIAHFVFTTDIQAIDPGAPSKAITIQAQNAAGSSEALDETADIALSSSSATGEFSSSNTSWKAIATLTMSKGSANRTFYYKDTATGDDTLTVSVKARTTGTSWSASQVIRVGTGSSFGGSSDSGGTSADNSGAGSSATSTSSGGSSDASDSDPVPPVQYSSSVSSHSDPEPLSDVGDHPDLSIGAGRDRLALAGSPVLFRANIKGSAKPDLSWTFGDGAQSAGAEVSHTYYFPGMYDVVLAGANGAVHATARAKVRVIAPSFALSAAAGGGEKVENDSAYEANISGWHLVSGNTDFAFPRDTIVAQRSSIIFPSAITGIPPGYRVALDSPLGAEIAADAPLPLVAAAASTGPAATAVSSSVPAVAVIPQAQPLVATAPAGAADIAPSKPMPKDLFAAIPRTHAQPSLPARNADIAEPATSTIASLSASAPSQAAEAFAPASPWKRMKDFFADWF